MEKSATSFFYWPAIIACSNSERSIDPASLKMFVVPPVFDIAFVILLVTLGGVAAAFASRMAAKPSEPTLTAANDSRALLRVAGIPLPSRMVLRDL